MINKVLLLIWLGLSITPNTLIGQTEQLFVNLSNPKQPSKIIFTNIKGSINVIGYAGDVVIVEATQRNFVKDDSKSNGLRKVPTNGFKLTAEEDNNEIQIKCQSNDKTIDFVIKVPFNISLQLKTVDNGKININGVIGTIETTNINGNIILEDVSGSVIANTIDGDIKAVFKSVYNDSPLVFTSVQGKIEVVFPANINAIFKMKSEFGEIFSDFDMTYEKRIPIVKKKNTTSIITLDNWTIGKVNNGGPEYLFNTYNGNIYITKK